MTDTKEVEATEDALAAVEGVTPDPAPEELSADEQAVKANRESMAVLANMGLLTDSFSVNLALR